LYSQDLIIDMYKI